MAGRGGPNRTRRFISSRRQRSPITSTVVEAGSDEEAEGDHADGPEVDADVEKIEVHVHVHRGQGDEGKKAARRRRPARSLFRGSLGDWQGHYERIYKRLQQEGPPPPPAAESTLSSKCHACGFPLGVLVRTCPQCEAAQPRGFLGKVAVALGLASVIGVFGLALHLSGDSVKEHRPPEPLRAWSEDDSPMVIEMPPTPSPFGAGSFRRPMPFYDPTSSQ